jgi:YesN/AraC family two-component response regulator
LNHAFFVNETIFLLKICQKMNMKIAERIDRVYREAPFEGLRLTPIPGQLATAVGYSSPAYFCKVFKKVTGRDPRAS